MGVNFQVSIAKPLHLLSRSPISMFGLSELALSQPREIALATSKGNQIANHQGAAAPAGQIKAFQDMCRNGWQFRRHAGGLYNCAGLVWASRRTGISQSQDWNRILQDDEYRQTTAPQIDDLVLYFDLDDDVYVHVARVIEVKCGITPESSPIPFVLSKWGHNLGECIHRAADHRLPEQYNVKIEYWTERPKNDTHTA